MIERAIAGAGAGIALVMITWEPAGLHTSERRWAVVVAIAVAAAVAASLEHVEARLGDVAAVPVLASAALMTQYACVPETDQIPRVAAVAAGFTAYELIARNRLPDSWRVGLLLLVGWAGLFGTAGRQSALVGAAFSWWPFVLLLALGTRAEHLRRRAPSGAWHRWLAVTTVAIVAAVAVARTGALEPEVTPAVVAVAAAAALSGAVGWLAVGRARS